MNSFDNTYRMVFTKKLTDEQKTTLSKKIKTRFCHHCGAEFICHTLKTWSFKFINLKGKKIVTCSNTCHNIEVRKNENNRYRK